jgi:hypothetical protein
VKSNAQNIKVGPASNATVLVAQIKQEKEALVSMFLANASITELAAQYKLIDDLNSKINQGRGKSKLR